MFEVEKIRQDFPMLQQYPELVYFDNGATTFKPQPVIDAVVDFYTKHTSNVHRGDYPLSVQADRLYDQTRQIIAQFINCSEKEIAFTHNDTASLNIVAYGLRKHLKKDDVVLVTEAEHASNLLPWYKMVQDYGIRIEYVPVNHQGVVAIEDIEKAIHDKVKVISIAEVTNVLGSIQPIEQICKVAHQHGILVVVDGAQSVPHRKTDVKAMDVDFLTFSAHKMCGPGGVGVLYGKYELLQELDPIFLGGGMNSRFQSCGTMQLKNAPEKFEAGTPNIEGVIGLGAAARYLMDIGMDQIEAYEKELRMMFAEGVKKLDNITFYNPDNHSGPVTFNANGVFAQDAAGYLSSRNVAVRSGNHCAKILHEVIGTDQTIRASLYFYNTKDEVLRCLDAMKDISVENAIGIFF